MDMPEQRLSRRLQRTLLAFFLLAVLFLVVVYVAAPSIYTNTLLLEPAPTGRYPAAATLVLVAFGGMILDIPATILQWTGILPSLFPVWYSLCRMGASLVAVGIAVWMLLIYRHHRVWARGRQAKTPAITR